MRRSSLATLTGLEPATSAVTGRRANQLRHRALLFAVLFARERTLVDAMRITQIGQPRPCFAQVRTLFFGCSMPAARDRASRTACSPADPIRTPSQEDALSTLAPVRWGHTPSTCPPAPYTGPLRCPSVDLRTWSAQIGATYAPGLVHSGRASPSQAQVQVPLDPAGRPSARTPKCRKSRPPPPW